MSAAVHAPARGAAGLELEAAITATPAAAVAQQLAILGSELPGFDNGDRQQLRRIAFALGGMLADPAEALRLARDAVDKRCLGAPQQSRPEAVLLMAVLWLLVDGERSAAGAVSQAR